MLGTSRACEFENPRTPSIRTPLKERYWETSGKDVKEHASFQQISTKQAGFQFATMSSLWPSMVCSCPVISRGLGRRDISLHPPEAGKETRGKAGKPAGAELEVAGPEGKQLGAVSDVGS